MKLLYHIPMLGKLMIISASLLAPLAVLLYLSVVNVNDQIRFSQLELYGNAYLRPLVALLEHLPLAAQGDSAAASKIDAVFSTLKNVQKQYGEDLQFTAEGLGKRDRSHLSPEKVAMAWKSAGDAPERVMAVTDMVMGMIAHAGDTSNLILDPDLDSYYLMDLTLLALPQTQYRLAEIIDYGDEVFEQGAITEDHRRHFNTFAALLQQSDFDRVSASTATAVMEDPNFYGVSPTMEPNVTTAFASYKAATEPLIALLGKVAEGTDVERAELATAVRNARQAAFRYWDAVIAEQDALLDVRVDTLRANKNTLLVTTGVCLLFAGLVVFFIARSITRPLKNLTAVSSDAAQGKMDSRANIYGKDEVGQLAVAFNGLLGANEEALSSAKEAKCKADEQACKAEAAALKAEDACKAAECARDEGRQQAVEHLSSIAHRLGQAAEELSMLIAQSSKHSSLQKDKVSETVTAIEEMNASILEVARNASDASKHSQDAKEKANDGAVIVREAVAAIEQLKEKSLSLKDKLLHLDTQARGIGQIMNVINDIADQTNLLALNAAIEAARAGDAGRGFAVVADEVRKLAEKTMEATKEVGQAITKIQQGAEDSTNAMDQTATLVTEAVGLAERSGNTLQEIVGMSVATSEQVLAIATAAEQQSAASEQITQTTGEVNRSALESSQALAESERAMEALAMLSSDLQRIINELR